MSETSDTNMRKLIRFSPTYRSDFDSVGMEEFETWKGSRGLSENEYRNWIMHRRRLNALCGIYCEVFKAHRLTHNQLLNKLAALCGPGDHYLFGRTVWEALKARPLKAKPVSPERVRRYMRDLMKSVEFSSPHASYEERLRILEDDLINTGLREMVPTESSLTELLRKPRRRK